MTETHDAHLRRRLERVARRAEELRETLETLAKELEEIGGILDEIAWILEQRAGGDPEGSTRMIESLYSPAELSMFRREAAAGIARLEVRVQPDGMAAVSLNGREPVLLPPKLRVLLDILTPPDTAADDGLVAWRSRIDVNDALRKRLDRPLGRDDLTRTVFRLRKALRLAHENPFLVQVNREHNTVRFALRADAVRIWQE